MNDNKVTCIQQNICESCYKQYQVVQMPIKDKDTDKIEYEYAGRYCPYCGADNIPMIFTDEEVK